MMNTPEEIIGGTTESDFQAKLEKKSQELGVKLLPPNWELMVIQTHLTLQE